MYKSVDGVKTEMTAEEIEEYNKSIEGLPSSDDINLRNLRIKRNVLLEETDWMCFPDSPTMSDEWKKYRQELRDITKTYKTLDDVKWPTKPS